MHSFMSWVLAAGFTLTVVCQADGAPSVGQRPAARPVDAVAAILDAFRTHPVVALDEEHADERSHAFRLTLIRDPRFPFVVNDVVVEFGNALHQDVMDRFVAGDRVADETLKKIWQDTTQAHTIWDRPIYEDFFREVRAVNAALPSDRRLRVLLGDPPIDWTTISTPEDLRNASAGRGVHPAGVVRRDVLAKGRRALLIYGAIHLWRHNPRQPGINLIERLERETGTKAFVAITHPFAGAKRQAERSREQPCIAGIDSGCAATRGRATSFRSRSSNASRRPRRSSAGRVRSSSCSRCRRTPPHPIRCSSR